MASPVRLAVGHCDAEGCGSRVPEDARASGSAVTESILFDAAPVLAALIGPGTIGLVLLPREGDCMKIVVDAMGGDHAPEVVVAGAVAEAKERGTEIILVGHRRAGARRTGEAPRGRLTSPSRSYTPPKSSRWPSIRWPSGRRRTPPSSWACGS